MIEVAVDVMTAVTLDAARVAVRAVADTRIPKDKEEAEDEAEDEVSNRQGEVISIFYTTMNPNGRAYLWTSAHRT
jgi:hypothetical protein